MINSKVFLRGLFSIKRLDSPGIALGASFIAIGALLKNIGFTIHESIFSSFLIYALPGSLVLAESIIIGASLLNIFLAVWLVISLRENRPLQAQFHMMLLQKDLSSITRSFFF